MRNRWWTIKWFRVNHGMFISQALSNKFRSIPSSYPHNYTLNLPMESLLWFRGSKPTKASLFLSGGFPSGGTRTSHPFHGIFIKKNPSKKWGTMASAPGFPGSQSRFGGQGGIQASAGGVPLGKGGIGKNQGAAMRRRGPGWKRWGFHSYGFHLGILFCKHQTNSHSLVKLVAYGFDTWSTQRVYRFTGNVEVDFMWIVILVWWRALIYG